MTCVSSGYSFVLGYFLSSSRLSFFRFRSHCTHTSLVDVEKSMCAQSLCSERERERERAKQMIQCAPSLGRLWPLALAICPVSPPLQFALPLLLALIMISTVSFTSGGSNLLVCSFYSSASAFSPHPLLLSFLFSLFLARPRSFRSSLSLSSPLFSSLLLSSPLLSSPLLSSPLSLSFAPPLISKPLIHVHTHWETHVLID